MQTTQHILVIRLSAMGDVAMTVPVLRAFTQQHPKVKLTVLTRPFFAPFFKDLPNTSVFIFDEKQKHKGIFGLYKLYKELKALNIDKVADLHNVLRTKILKLFFFRKTFVQIDKGRAEKKALINGDSFKPLKTTHERYADVFRKLGYSLDLSNPRFPERKTLPKLIIEQVQPSKKQWIGIAPFAQYPSKIYPLSQMKNVVNALEEQYNIFLFGAKAEQQQLSELSSSKNVVNVAGLLNFEDELDLISNLDLMVAMDSGNAHLAAMLGVKVLTIWGVTHPYAGFSAFNQPLDYHLLPNRNTFIKIPTSIYGNKYPEDYKDVAGSIASEEVIEKIQSILKA
ncbi:glycosyltransferase family 9 protein [Mesoflavibacter zeaxanthinifaciens]|uniref:glycosyltransferase family 9 protein n=1 Tax=Mesoflavibacter zeaxanthinifaciens TaxID=393060 RepID=UPI0026F0E589|nr:glycosyltransferase family 9 protein [Mesoflavibacter zeaxanthinifaciens]